MVLLCSKEELKCSKLDIHFNYYYLLCDNRQHFQSRKVVNEIARSESKFIFFIALMRDTFGNSSHLHMFLQEVK